MLKLVLVLLLSSSPLLAQEQAKPVLWQMPADLATRSLTYGIGGKADAPSGRMHFRREDRHGNSPKFDVEDEQGRKWKVKLGPEARSETAATRLLWAVGYFTDEDYYAPKLDVDGLPALHRGRQFQHGTEVTGARLELESKARKHAGNWQWRRNPFTGTRELNGLRVLMCLVNNWDLKDENNSIVPQPERAEDVYLVADLGATFGKAGRSWTSDMSKNNPQDYQHARFITRRTDTYVDFNIAQHPPLLYALNIVEPWRYWQFYRLHWIGKHIPRQDVRWIASLLAQLTDEQMREAFTSAGYNAQETATLTETLKGRIAQLRDL